MTMFSDAAAFYNGLGWAVFPLKAGAKVPAVSKSEGGAGFKDATTDARQIDAWEMAYPTANIGVATGAISGVLVVDVDPRNGGLDSMAALSGRNLVFPPCPEARTGNNGLHLFLAYDPRIRASKDKLGKGIDLKTDGGYVVAAPSTIKPSEQGPGGTYRWVKAPDRIRLPAPPHWMLQLLAPKPRPIQRFEPRQTTEAAARSLEGIAQRLARAPKGERNNVLNWGAYQGAQLVKQGRIGTSTVTSRLTQAALHAGLPLGEVQATIASAFTAVNGGGGR